MTLIPAPRGTEPPHTCRTCELGCGCPHTGPGCGHYGCFGRWPTADCPGVKAEEARYAALLAAKRTAEVRAHNTRTHYAALYRGVVESVLLGILTR